MYIQYVCKNALVGAWDSFPRHFNRISGKGQERNGENGMAKKEREIRKGKEKSEQEREKEICLTHLYFSEV